MIPILCSNLDELDEPEAKASLIWIIGEYANTIDNADELLGIFVDSFTEESYPVRVSHFNVVEERKLDLPFAHIGATPNTDCGCEAVLEETRFISRDCAENSEHCDERL